MRPTSARRRCWRVGPGGRGCGDRGGAEDESGGRWMARSGGRGRRRAGVHGEDGWSATGAGSDVGGQWG
ncbi:hypothetical protein EA187_07250 [Lujinxingia sediminis]|uniref:Uncharacterized protein n=1 Tax=Lujinxingia sediminis TaxID=2480984 RepID=A0ABY0CWD2_9DELT|nr:hypothetical protein EA187_07250 [Lujinxingia sediminis]